MISTLFSCVFVFSRALPFVRLNPLTIEARSFIVDEDQNKFLRNENKGVFFMKKLVLAIAAAILSLLAASCGGGAVASPEPETYVEDSIRVNISENDYEFERHFRDLYYYVPAEFADLVDHDAYEAWTAEENLEEEPPQMRLLTLIQKFNISKKAFEKANQKYKKACKQKGLDLQDEKYEAPNATVLFSLDSDKINDYYRLER